VFLFLYIKKQKKRPPPLRNQSGGGIFFPHPKKENYILKIGKKEKNLEKKKKIFF